MQTANAKIKTGRVTDQQISGSSDLIVPSFISDAENVTIAADYTSAYNYFSIMPTEDGDIAVVLYLSGETVIFPVIAGIPLMGAFKEVKLADTTVSTFIAFV